MLPLLADDGLTRFAFLGGLPSAFAISRPIGGGTLGAGTYFDASGTLQSAAADAPRCSYHPITHAPLGLLIEGQATNLFLNSAVGATQTIAVTAQAYTLSFYGTGTVTLSGTSSGATAGTGALVRVQRTFTPTAGGLTLTVAGSTAYVQLESGTVATSPILTAGAALTRAADMVTLTPAAAAALLSPTQGTIWWRGTVLQPAGSVGQGLLSVDDGTDNNKLVLNNPPGGAVGQSDIITGGVARALISTANSFTPGVAFGAGLRWSAGKADVTISGGGLATAVWTLPTGLSGLVVGNSRAGNRPMNGYLQSLTFVRTNVSDPTFKALSK